jgi:glutamyl-tRNA synthetase
VRYSGRFAPSPTGSLHLGSVATALFAVARARQQTGEVILRVEDLDRARVVAGSEAEQREDLRWLGLDLVEPATLGLGPTRQSERTTRYDAAIAALEAAGHTYLCDCSRAEIARAASAPHEGEEGPAYPGTCRPHGMEARKWKRPPALRLAAPGGEVDDFVLKRGDGVYAYQLAVVVDDLAMGISEIVRGADLRSSVPRQVVLAKLLGGELPPVVHVPLLVGPSGARLAKRDGGSTVRELRQRGVSAPRILQSVARAYGFEVSAGDVVAELAAVFDPLKFSMGPVSLGEVEAAA